MKLFTRRIRHALGCRVSIPWLLAQYLPFYYQPSNPSRETRLWTRLSQQLVHLFRCQGVVMDMEAFGDDLTHYALLVDQYHR